MNMNYHDEYNDEESSVDTAPPPPPPPPEEIAVGNSKTRSQVEDEKYHQQLNLFKNMADFSLTTSRDGSHDGTLEEENDVEIPPPKNINRMGGSSWWNRHRKPIMYGSIAACLLLVIVIIMSVGFGTGAFQGGDDGSGSRGTPSQPTNPNATPEDQERSLRLREYLMSVGARGTAMFNDPISPESQALDWMSYEDPAKLDPIDFDNHLRIDQRFALLSLWFQSEFEWFDQSNWLTEDECTWVGVTCVPVTPKLRRTLKENDDSRHLQEGDQLVSSLSLRQNNIQGKLPRDLSLLKYLKTLNLSSNQMSGPIPAALSSFQYLEELYLDNNALSGELNIDFSGMTGLLVVDVSSNQISGSIPPSLWTVTQIQKILLDNNQFTATISDDVGDLVNLVTFTAGDNALEGSIPSAFGSMGLEELDLGGNNFSGALPEGLLTNANLRSLDLGDNDLTGEIDLTGLSSLQAVNLEDNSFTGALPDVSTFPNLVTYRMGRNDFEIQGFPTYLLGLTNLTNVGLNDLSIGGAIPTGVGGWTNMETLNLHGNAFTGTIPFSVANAESLKELSLNNNQLSGSIPFEISFLRNLEILSLESNQLDSTIPVAFGGLTSLKTLLLRGNLLSGQIPVSMAALTNLEAIDVSNNGLAGSIPDGIWSIPSLRSIELAGNDFVGQLPSSIGASQLEILNFASNKLQGTIPDSIVGLTNLFVLDLTSNFFGGPLPDDIGDLSSLRVLRLGTNYAENGAMFGFSGTIPASIANMKDLVRLELNENKLTGILPPEHGELQNVRLYDVSSNAELQGTVPGEFADMVQLRDFVVTGTNIEGSIPAAVCELDVSVEIECPGNVAECSCCQCGR